MITLITRAAAFVALVFFFLSGVATAAAESWESTVSPFVAGSLSPPRPLHARYNFGWSGLTAGNGDFRLEKPSDSRLRLKATGNSVGLARLLWRYDVAHTATADAETLRSLLVHEVELFRTKQVTTDLAYSPTGVTSTREDRKPEGVENKTRRFDFPNVQSVFSALLFLRSQPWPDGAVHRVVVYPATSAYLCTVAKVDRERITVPTGNYEAIKLDLKLSKIGKERELLPHKKFRTATIWLSNDADRLVLRVEVQIFIGKVFAELQSVQFDPQP